MVWLFAPGLRVGGENRSPVGGGTGGEQSAQEAVDDEVREAADGRGEVGVAGACESEVADVLFAVARLLERPQHEVGEDALFGRADDPRGEALVHLRGNGDVLGHLVSLSLAVGSPDIAAVAAGLDAPYGQAGEAERVAELAGGFLEIEDAFGVGSLVDAIDARGLGLDPVGDALVGREHELLDEAVRPPALRAHNGLHVAVGIELDDGLGEVEVDGAAALTLGVELERELIHLVYSRDQFVAIDVKVAGVLGADGVEDLVGGLLIEQRLDQRVGEARLAADDALADLVAEDLAVGVDLHEAAKDEAVFLGTQRAHARRQLRREHGDGAVGEVDGGAAQAGLEI